MFQVLVLLGPTNLSYAAAHYDLLIQSPDDLIVNIQYAVLPAETASGQKPPLHSLSDFFEIFPLPVHRSLYQEIMHDQEGTLSFKSKQMAAAIASVVDQASS